MGTFSWQWSAATANGGTYTAIAGATNAAFIPGDDEVGKFLQVCASFMDMATTPNSEMRCLQIATAVANINDKPTASNLFTTRALTVNVNANAANPYIFKATDFPLTDADDDMLAAVIVQTLPFRGTMALDGTVLTNADVPTMEITVAQLTARELTYYPESGQEPNDPDDLGDAYTSFNFNVVDDGSDGTDNKTSTNNAIASIRLVVAAQVAASGRPGIIPVTTAENPTYAEGTRLSTGVGGITEPNGIDGSTLMWQWQQAVAPDSGTPADNDYSAITDATTTIFTPGQEQVGQYIRVCASFMDSHPMPVSETLCSVAARVVPGSLRLRLRIFLEGPLR